MQPEILNDSKRSLHIYYAVHILIKLKLLIE